MDPNTRAAWDAEIAALQAQPEYMAYCKRILTLIERRLDAQGWSQHAASVAASGPWLEAFEDRTQRTDADMATWVLDAWLLDQSLYDAFYNQ